MKSFFKFLSRNKLYAFIEVLGLSVALTIVLFIGKYSYDKFHENSENFFFL